MQAKKWFSTFFITAVIAIFTPPPLDLTSGSYLICMNDVIIRGDSISSCSYLNRSICEPPSDELKLFTMECRLLYVPINASIHQNNEDLQIYLKDARNYMISLVILGLNVIGMMAFAVYKWCRRKRGSNEEEPLTMTRWVRNEAGDFVMDNTEDPSMTARVNRTREEDPLTI